MHVALDEFSKVDDRRIWEIARKNGYCIVTKDWDFKFMSVSFGCPPKVIRLNCGNRTTAFIANLLRQRFWAIDEFLKNGEDCYLEIQ